MEETYTKEQVERMVALYAYNWNTDMIKLHLRLKNNGEWPTVEDIYKDNKNWPMIEWDKNKLNNLF